MKYSIKDINHTEAHVEFTVAIEESSFRDIGANYKKMNELKENAFVPYIDDYNFSISSTYVEKLDKKQYRIKCVADEFTTLLKDLESIILLGECFLEKTKE